MIEISCSLNWIADCVWLRLLALSLRDWKSQQWVKSRCIACNNKKQTKSDFSPPTKEEKEKNYKTTSVTSREEEVEWKFRIVSIIVGFGSCCEGRKLFNVFYPFWKFKKVWRHFNEVTMNKKESKMKLNCANIYLDTFCLVNERQLIVFNHESLPKNILIRKVE